MNHISKLNDRVKKAALILVIIILSSCSSTKKVNFKDFSKTIVQLPFKIETIEIIDTRLNLLPMNWEVPMFASKKREWIGNPKVSEINKSDIIRIIKQSEDINGIPVKMKYNIIEGVCKLNSDWKTVKEYAKFRSELIVEVPTQNRTYTYSGEIFYDQPTINVTEEHTLKLYDLAIRNTTHLILNRLKEDL